MKRIRPTNLIAAPLYRAFVVFARNRPSFFSTQVSSFSFTCITERIHVTVMNSAAIITNEVSTTIQMPK